MKSILFKKRLNPTIVILKCNIMFLLFKYLNNNFFLIVNTLLIKRKRNTAHIIVDQYNFYKNYTNNKILITINQYILIITTNIMFLLPTP